MVKILRDRARRETQAPAKTFERHASAEHLVGDRNRVISFDDVRALPEPEWATTPAPQPFHPGRYEWDALVPAGWIAAVALDDTEGEAAP